MSWPDKMIRQFDYDHKKSIQKVKVKNQAKKTTNLQRDQKNVLASVTACHAIFVGAGQL